MVSITTALGAGSGIDTKALIESLAAAQKEPKAALLTKRETANQASVSTLANLAGAIDSFASALASLVGGGTLYSQPNLSDTTAFTASALPGASLGGLSAQVRVERLAQAQTLASTGLASSTAPVGEGTLTLNVGGVDHAITIGSGNNTLAGLAKAINDKKAGVTATVITDQGQSKLILKGATGEANAFTLSVPGGTSSGLERFAYGPGVTDGMTRPQEALDAVIMLDGVEVRRPTNSFSDLIEGVQIDLKQAKPGTVINMGLTRPTEGIKQAVADFVTAYNELHAMLAEATAPAADDGSGGGPLRRDLSVSEMKRQLAGLTSSVLNSSGGPSSLAEVGVSTNRNGTLSLNAATLQTALDRDPDGVEKLFNPGQYSSNPLIAISSKIGKVKPGVYTITDVTPGSPGVPATGKVNGVAMIGSETGLVAPASSSALGMILKISGPVASATITVDAGLGGALQSIRDSLRATSGPIATAQARLRKEAENISQDREKLEVRSEAYYNQLVANYARMEARVSAFKATQSYLQQQIDAWSGKNS